MPDWRCRPGAALLAVLASPLGFTQVPFNLPQSFIAVDASLKPVLYTSSYPAGPFRSTDGGATWTQMALTERGLPQPRINAIVADPNNASVVFAGGELKAGGVWKSADKGESWSRAGAGLPQGEGEVKQLFLPPDSPATVYAQVGSALYKSTDAGGTWALRSTLPSSGPFTINPRRPSLMFCAKSPSVYRSADEGAHWAVVGGIHLDLIGSNSSSGITDLESDPWNPAVVYAAVRGGLLWVGSESIIGVYKSSDQGSTWTNIAPDVEARHVVVDPTGRPNLYYTYPESNTVCRSSSPGGPWKCTAVGPRPTGEIRIAISAANPNLIYGAASDGIYKSGDGGDTWQRLGGTFRLTLALPGPPLDFTLQAGSVGMRVWEISALESAKTAVPFTLSTSGESWLSVSPASGSTAASAAVKVSAAGLAPGTYTATIRLAAPEAANHDTAVPVRLTVTEARAAATSYYTVNAFAGTGTSGSGGDAGAATSAQFSSPAALAFDAAGNLFVADSGNHRVRKIGLDGAVQTVAGTGQFGFSGDAGPASAARLWRPEGLAVDAEDNLLVADSFNGRIRRVTPAGTIASIAGQGTGALTSLSWPRGMAFDARRNLVIADAGLPRIQRLNATGSTGIALGEGLDSPSDVAVEGTGNLLVADRDHHRICRIAPSGVVTTVAGSGVAGFQGDGGPATAAWLYKPEGVAVDLAGTIYIADTGNHRVRAVSPDGMITTLAGTGESGSSGTGGPGTTAQLRSPVDIALDTAGNLYVADKGNHRIVKLMRQALSPPTVRPDGVVSAGSLVPAMAPGSLIVIAGDNLSASTAQSGGAPWPTALAGTTVRINGVAAPLSFAGPTQINAQVPVELAPGPATLTVSVDSPAGGALGGAPVALTLGAAAPAILIADGRAYALNEDGSRNRAENPSSPGSLMTVYLTGQGPVDLPVESGRAAIEDPPSRAILPKTAAFGDQEAEILYIELVPGEVGLARAIVRVPALPSGDYPLIIAVDGVASNPATVSVQGVE